MKKYGEALKKTAEMHGKTEAYVRMILRGERSNDEILATYNKIVAGTEKLVEKIQEKLTQA